MINHHDIINCLQAFFQDIQGVYLFGSYAQGTATSQSDVDIAILTVSKPQEDSLLTASEALAIQLKVEHVDLVDLKRAGVVFQEEIIKTGHRIYSFDDIFCDNYESYIYRKAMDFNWSRKTLINDIIDRGNIHG